jgi:hypothetical protein
MTQKVFVTDYTNVLIADIVFASLVLVAWLIWLRKDWIALGFIVFYISMIPIWHYYSGTFESLGL